MLQRESLWEELKENLSSEIIKMTYVDIYSPSIEKEEYIDMVKREKNCNQLGFIYFLIPSTWKWKTKNEI